MGEENWVWTKRSESFCSVLRLLVHPSFLLTLLAFVDEGGEGSRIRVEFHRRFVVGFCIP